MPLDRRTPSARRRRGSATLAPAVLALLAVGLTGCTSPSGQEGTEPAPEPSSSASGSATLTPLEQAPRDAREVGTDVFTLTAPADLTQSTRPGPEDVEMLVLSATDARPGAVVEVVAFSDPELDANVVDSMDVLVRSLRDVRRAQDVTSSRVEWPGAELAIAVSWTQETQSADGPVTEHYLQLTTLAEDGRSATALAVAPADVFDSSGVADVVRTFRFTDT